LQEKSDLFLINGCFYDIMKVNPRENKHMKTEINKPNNSGTSGYVNINSNGVTDFAGRQIFHYKGNQLAAPHNIGKSFTACVNKIANNYKIDGYNVEILNIKAITASNEETERNKPTDKKPLSKDKVSTKDSKDKFTWHIITARIGTAIIRTEWLCWAGHGYASLASQNIVETFIKGLNHSKGISAKEIVTLLERTYRAKDARFQSYQQPRTQLLRTA